MGYASDYAKGKSGDNSSGTPASNDGFRDRGRNNQEWADKFSRLIRENGKGLNWGGSVREKPRREPDAGLPSPPPDKSTTPDIFKTSLSDILADLVECVVYGVIAISFVVFFLNGDLDLSQKTETETLVLIGLYVALFMASIGYARLLHSWLDNAIDSAILHIIAWTSSLAVSAIGVLALLHFLLT